MSVFFIHEANLQAFLFELDASRVIAQASVANGEPDLEALSRDTAHPLALRRPRAPSSIKSLLFPAKERVAVYPSNDIHSPPAVSGEEPTVVAGLRACDIVAARLLDSIFIQDDYVDPFYSLRRDGLRMVTVDCVEPAASCFCTLVGGKPYAVDGFDVNLSPIDGGYVVEAGSEKGREMLVAGMSLLREATDDEVAARDAARAAAQQTLAEQNAPYATVDDPQAIIAGAIEADCWGREAGKCVECGSCSAICPTCHCFQLFDQASDDAAGPHERMKTWDSCLMSGYSRMAGVGGMKASPRPELRQRLANRVIHKFAWFPETMGFLGCVGCGRCTDACLGGGDLRRLLKDLETVAAEV